MHLTNDITQDGTTKIKDCLKVGEIIEINSSIKSPNGKYDLVLQGDGNFVLYASGGRALWASNTSDFRKAVRGLLQDDGNLRLFDDSDRESWSSRTGGKGNASSVLIIQDDGNVVLNSDGKVIWTTNTMQVPEEEKPKPAEPKPIGPTKDRLKPGESLTRYQGLTSASGEYTLIMQDDSNLVLYKKDKGAIWAKGSGAGNTAEKLVFRGDGELELLTWSGNQKWVSGTPGRGNSNSSFMVRDDGNMVISTDGQIVWSSKTGPEIFVGKRDRINGGGRLLLGEMLTSPNGKFTLTFQSDSNFVLYEGDAAKWSSGEISFESGDGWVQVDKEGNLAKFGDQRLQWSSRTRYRRNGGDAALILQDEGVAVLKLDGITIWSTNGALVQTYELHDFESVTSGDKLSPGQYLAVGQSITSKNGKISATVQDNGQFAVHHNETKDILYTSNKPPGTTPSKLTVGYNDDVILWGLNETKIWQCTPNQDDSEAFFDEDDRERFFNRQPPGSIVLGDKGNMNLYSSSWPNHSIWTSSSAFPGFSGTVSELKPGETLLVGQNMLSGNGDHELSLLPSGNLRTRNTRFNSNAYYFTIPDSTIQDARYLSFGRDLVLEIRGADNRSIWRAENRKRDPSDHHGDGHHPYEPPRFILDNDADAYVRAIDYMAWHIRNLPSGPAQRQTSIGDSLRPGITIGLEQFLRSKNGEYIARFNTKGEFELISNRDGGPSRRGEQLWRSNASKADSVWMTADGNLSVGTGGNVKWQSNTGGQAGQGEVVLVVQDDGNMCTYVGGKPTFSTGTAGG